MAKLVIPHRRRPVVSWLVRGIIAAAILISFFALDPILAGSLAVVLFLSQFFLERLSYYQKILHVMPMPSFKLAEEKLGSIWMERDDGVLTFGQLFSTKRSAKECYRLFRSWNFNRYIDEVGNIQLRAVREELDRYTILLYPGERGVNQYHEDFLKQEFGESVEARMHVLAAWFGTYADYWDRPESKRMVESLESREEILLNAFYLVGQNAEAVAKKPLRLSVFSIAGREEVEAKSLEGLIEWQDPWKGVPSDVRRKYDGVWGDRTIVAKDT